MSKKIISTPGINTLPVVRGIKQLKYLFNILYAIPHTIHKLINSAHTRTLRLGEYSR